MFDMKLYVTYNPFNVSALSSKACLSCQPGLRVRSWQQQLVAGNSLTTAAAVLRAYEFRAQEGDV